MHKHTRRLAPTALAAVAVAGSLTACSGSGDDDGITLTVQVFGGSGFGYEELIEQYESDNPDITVDYQIVTDDYDNEFRPNLIQQLDAGAGAGDIVGIEEQGVGQMMAMSDHWVDLAEYGLDSREDDYPAWKWDLGFTADEKLAALGTDVGGMAMCYRTDLFDAAGLPTDREDVSALWPDWEAFAEVAADFVESDVDAAFVDSPNQLYNVRLVQEAGSADGLSYFDREDAYILGENDAVRTAFDFVDDMNQLGAVGQFQNWTEEWFQAMQTGGFATMSCPSWMAGVVADNSGEDNADNWDLATVPGGSGNWGGSWLGVPSQSEHPEEAAALLDYLTSAEGQVGAFEAVGNFPSSPDAQADPAVADMTHDYFNDAPLGHIITESVTSLQPVYYGELHSAVRAEVEDTLVTMINDDSSGSQVWDDFVAAGQGVVDASG